MHIKDKEYLTKILEQFILEASEKFEKGCNEHGGKIWLKRGLIKEMKQEAIDLYIYATALEDQLKGIKLGTKNDNKEANEIKSALKVYHKKYDKRRTSK